MSRSHLKRSSVFAVYDISSSSVAGAHVLTKPDPTHKTVLLAAARSNVLLHEYLDIKRFVADTITHLEEVIERVRKADIHQPSHIQVVLASPWYSSQTRTVVYKKEKPFICTQKLIDSLVDAEIKDIFSTQEGLFGKESTVIEKQVSAIKLNGYRTSVPHGKKVSILELSLTVTIASKSVLEKFTDTFKRSYGIRKISFTTSPFATFMVMQKIKPAAECTVIDVGEEVTDVAFIKDGIVLYQHSFPVGTYGLYRTLTEQGVHMPHESVALLESFRLGKLSAKAKIAMEKAIKTFKSAWQAGFQQLLEEGAYGFCLPENMIITVDNRFETLIAESLNTDPFINHCCAKGKIRLTFMDESMIGSAITTSDQTSLDIPLATAALFVEGFL